LELGGGNIVNPNSTGSEITSATFGIGQNIHLEERQVNGAFSDRTDLAIVTNSGFGLGESEKIRIEAGGNVGIGTASPAVGLHVSRGGMGYLLLQVLLKLTAHYAYLVLQLVRNRFWYEFL
jgi:hypothetical protein